MAMAGDAAQAARAVAPSPEGAAAAGGGPFAAEALRSLLPVPSPDANKYSRGKLVLVAGSAGYPGAACLAVAAAGRMGAGYTEAFCVAETLPVLRAWRPSAVARCWDAFSAEAVNEAARRHPVAVAAGSGMAGAAPHEVALVLKVLRQVEAPVLADGGALAVLATAEGRAAAQHRADKGWPLVLTPHGGEAARLARGARVSAEGPQQLAEALAAAYGCTVVLKGPETFVAQPGRAAIIMAHGTPALAKAGTGDVLAGTVGALLAQGLAPADAAALGTWLHAEAGRIAAERLGAISVMAEDVAEALPLAIQALG